MNSNYIIIYEVVKEKVLKELFWIRKTIKVLRVLEAEDLKI